MVFRMQPGRATRLTDPAGGEEPDDALPVARPCGQQLQHPVVVGARTREGVADVVSEVIIAHAHRIGVAERADARLRRSPRPDTRL